jgi:hypothetical protein
MDYYSKYLKYKQKYSQLKYQSGGAKTILTKENTKIIQERFINNGNNKIMDKDILDLLNKAYKREMTDFIPHSIENEECIMWKILCGDKLVGFGVLTDLKQFEEFKKFYEISGIKGGRCLYISSVAGDDKYSGVVKLLFEAINKYAKKNNYEYLLLEANKYEDNYLVRLYGKHGFKPIKELTDDGETGTVMCKDIKDDFNCFDKIKANIGVI